MMWLFDGMKTVATLCIVVAVIDCVTGEGELSEALRMLCSATVALATVRLATEAFRNFL